MTIRELKDDLSQYDENLEVFVGYCDIENGYSEGFVIGTKTKDLRTPFESTKEKCLVIFDNNYKG